MYKLAVGEWEEDFDLEIDIKHKRYLVLFFLLAHNNHPINS